MNKSTLADSSLVSDFDHGQSPRGGGGGSDRNLKQPIMVVVSIVAVVVAIFLVARETVLRKDSGDLSRQRTVICAETDEVFSGFKIKEGSVYPWKNPKTGEMSLYPAERCYWIQIDGEWKAKNDPTYVLLNEMKGKSGPTLCPDCGREVRGHNPMPPWQLLQEAEDEGR